MAKSKHRWKLIRDSVLIREKLWFGFWPRYKYDGQHMINTLKTQHVKLKEEMAKTEINLDLAEKQYQLYVNKLKKSQQKDRKGDSHSDWEVEKESYWFIPSILCWAKSAVPEPIDFDKKYYVLGHRPGQVRGGRARDKEMSIAIMEHEENDDEARRQLREGMTDKEEEGPMLIFREGNNKGNQQQNKGWRKKQTKSDGTKETDAEQQDRVKKAEGKHNSRQQNSDSQLK